MPYKPLAQQRLAAGLCLQCGARCSGTGSTQTRCALCAARRRVTAAAHRARLKQSPTPAEAAAVEVQKAQARQHHAECYAARKRAGCCVACGQRKTGADVLQNVVVCHFCRAARLPRMREARRRARRENSPWGDYNDGKPLPLGSAVSIGGVRQFCVKLDSGAFAALRELKKRDREARLKQSKDGKIEIVYQTSRIVRDALRSWADLTECPTRSPEYRKMIECQFNFCADVRTVAAIERHAPARGGNLSATVCDLLVATAKRPNFTPKRTVPRLSAGGGAVDPWDEE